MIIDTQRHLSVFNADKFNSENQRIDVVGCGAVGSHVALMVAKLGIQNIHLWDFDIVEAHNIANQAFDITDIGKSKVEALKDLIYNATGITPKVHCKKVESAESLGDVVFLLVDSMAGRKTIWESSIRYKMRTKLLIECRMGADNGRVYSILPSYRPHIAKYEGTYYSDEEVTEVNACGAVTSVGVTAQAISSIAMWQFIRWYDIYREKESLDTYENELIFAFRPMVIMGRVFK